MQRYTNFIRIKEINRLQNPLETVFIIKCNVELEIKEILSIIITYILNHLINSVHFRHW